MVFKIFVAYKGFQAQNVFVFLTILNATCITNSL
ncbi:Uncharacterised protein [Mesomycoplasma hyorhinis]|jgi:hypothetical protein|uniref:Uncharacterized protein n=1 Tax=Mesomycoplasma hyorhinis (strain MCLD) TaxID=936139 RepID=A0ABM5M6V2_MESHM|nr:hypothetical protein SRH_01800 [Mesomycoplasma hyorhinis MCLD]SYV90976.1 Uncharacterised protein [Mesomycoplasma hyorhinis]